MQQNPAKALANLRWSKVKPEDRSVLMKAAVNKRWAKHKKKVDKKPKKTRNAK